MAVDPVKCRPGAAVARPEPPPTSVVHKLKANQYMSHLAAAYNVRLEAILAANPGLNPRRLQIGQPIVVPLQAPTVASGGLSSAPDTRFTEEQLQPVIRDAAQRWGVDGDLLACIIRKESTFTNHTLHKDQKGVGLIGLTPNGELERFRAWAAPGKREDYPADRAIRLRAPPPPALQIEYLAMRMRELTDKYGSTDAALAMWRSGTPDTSEPRAAIYVPAVRSQFAQLSLRY